MGQLRTRLTNLSSMLTAALESAEKAEEARLNIVQESGRACEIMKEGMAVAYSYLRELFKKKGDNISAHLNDRIANHMDKELQKLLKGIEDARAQAERTTRPWVMVAGSLKGDLDRLKKAIDDTKPLIAKKKSKWIASKKYKTKIANYEKMLLDLEKDYQTKLVAAYNMMTEEDNAPPLVEFIKQLKIKPEDTLARFSSGTMVGAYNVVEARAKQGIVDVRKRRQANHFASAIATMAKWVAEADEMESESEES